MLRESISVYNQGGVKLFSKRVKEFITRSISDKIKFNPLIPPVSVIYRDKKFTLGYRDRYLYHFDGKYSVIPRPSDTVVEAGVYKGRDTAIFCKLAERVIGFEPSPRNYTDAKKNLDKFKNVELINKGLWNEKDDLEIKYGEYGGDDGFLQPDSDSGRRGKRVEVNTLESYLKELNVEKVDFLKIEAEGAEPEIIKGLSGIEIRNIVVNAGEERDGSPTGKEVMKLLHAQGYTLAGVKRGSVLFFTNESAPHYAFKTAFQKK